MCACARVCECVRVYVCACVSHGVWCGGFASVSCVCAFAIVCVRGRRNCASVRTRACAWVCVSIGEHFSARVSFAWACACRTTVCACVCRAAVLPPPWPLWVYSSARDARAATAARACLRSVRSAGCRARLGAGVTWASRTTSAEWAGRHGHSSVIDAAGAIYVIGGVGGKDPNYIYFNDVWVSTDGGKLDWRGTRGVLVGSSRGPRGVLAGYSWGPRGARVKRGRTWCSRDSQR